MGKKRKGEGEARSPPQERRAHPLPSSRAQVQLTDRPSSLGRSAGLSLGVLFVSPVYIDNRDLKPRAAVHVPHMTVWGLSLSGLSAAEVEK